MFTLIFSCLSVSNLPWFMDLTFLVPMQYYSFSALDFTFTTWHIHNWATFLLSPVSSFFMELFLRSSSVTYWIPTELGGSSHESLCSCGSQSKNPEVVCNFLLQGISFGQALTSRDMSFSCSTTCLEPQLYHCWSSLSMKLSPAKVNHCDTWGSWQRPCRRPLEESLGKAGAKVGGPPGGASSPGSLRPWAWPAARMAHSLQGSGSSALSSRPCQPCHPKCATTFHHGLTKLGTLGTGHYPDYPAPAFSMISGKPILGPLFSHCLFRPPPPCYSTIMILCTLIKCQMSSKNQWRGGVSVEAPPHPSFSL